MIVGITGYKGRLGAQLGMYDNCVPLVLDITDKDSVVREINRIKPDVIINCASSTNVDLAETQFEKSMLVNSRGVAHLRFAFSGRIIHISTDYVFDGKKGPYGTKRVANPLNAYGYTKYGGEIICKHYMPERETIIVRTTGLYGGISGRHDYARLVLEALGANEQLYASNELCGNQTYVPHLAEALYKMVDMPKLPSVVHVASIDIVSRYQFALMIAKEFGLDPLHIVPVSNKDIVGWVATRPSHAGLLVELAISLGLPVYHIQDGIKAYRESRENGSK